MKRLPTAEEKGRCLCRFFFSVSLDVRLAALKQMDGCLSTQHSAVAACTQLMCPMEIRWVKDCVGK